MNIIDERPYVPSTVQSVEISQFDKMLGEELTHLLEKFQRIEGISDLMVKDEERRALAGEVNDAFQTAHVDYNLAVFRFGFIINLCRVHEMHRFITIEGVEAESFDHWISLRKGDKHSITFAEQAYKQLKFVITEVGRDALEVLPAINGESLKAIGHVRQQWTRQTKQEAKQMPGYESLTPQEQDTVLHEVQQKQSHVLQAAVVSAIESPTNVNRRYNNDQNGVVTKLPVSYTVTANAAGTEFTLTAKVTREQLEHEIGDGYCFPVFSYYGKKNLSPGQLKELLVEEDLKSNF